MKNLFILLFLISTNAFSAQVLNTLLINQTSAAGQSSPAMSMNQMTEYDITANITAANGSNKTFTPGISAVDTLTFPAKVNATDGDYVKLFTSMDSTWAVGLDTTGLQQNTPTGAAWLSVPSANRSYCDLTNSSNRTYLARWSSQLNADAGGGSLVVTPTNGAAIAGGFLDLTGSSSKYVTFSAVANTDSQQTGAFEFIVKPNYSGTPATIQMFFSTSKATNSEIDMINFFHWTDGHIYFDLFDSTGTIIVEVDGGLWAPVSGTSYAYSVQYDLTVGSNKIFRNGAQIATNATTGTRDANILVSQIGASPQFVAANANFSIKNFVFYTSAVTAAIVATTAKNCLNALTGFSAQISADDSAANGTLVDTQVFSGPSAVPTPHNKNDSGAGSITTVQNTPGVTGTINNAQSSVTITNHGYLTGTKITLTTTGVLPGPLATATPYYLIVLDANTLRFATSQANALTGTFIVFTSSGSGTDTIVVTTTIAGTIKLQKSDDPLLTVNPVWFDIPSSSQSFSGTTALNWIGADSAFNQLRAVTTLTSGTVIMSIRANAKGW